MVPHADTSLVVIEKLVRGRRLEVVERPIGHSSARLGRHRVRSKRVYSLGSGVRNDLGRRGSEGSVNVKFREKILDHTVSWSSEPQSYTG
jgi:hypothetical protein